jgi:hypothetical protein
MAAWRNNHITPSRPTHGLFITVRSHKRVRVSCLRGPRHLYGSYVRGAILGGQGRGLEAPRQPMLLILISPAAARADAAAAPGCVSFAWNAGCSSCLFAQGTAQHFRWLPASGTSANSGGQPELRSLRGGVHRNVSRPWPGSWRPLAPTHRVCRRPCTSCYHSSSAPPTRRKGRSARASHPRVGPRVSEPHRRRPTRLHFADQCDQ